MISEAVRLLTENEDLLKAFNKNPAKTLESVLGVNLPDDQVNALVKGVKAKLGLDDVLEMAGKLKGLFGK